MVPEVVLRPRGHILIVDDEPSLRFLLRRILEHGGHEVREAEHGAAALVRLEAELPDLVVTDLMMPVMMGSELIHRMRSDPRLAALPILLVSANPEAIEEAERADAVISKPFHIAELLAIVTRLLREEETA